MPNLVNRMVVRDLTEELKDADAMVVVSFGGLTVAEAETLRGSLAAKGVRVRLVRNRLARIVLAERGIEFPPDVLSGNVAIAFGSSEAAIDAAKVFADKDVKKAGKVKVRGGLLEGDVLDAGSAASLADIPDRNTLRAQVLGVIAGPARSLATVLNAVPSAVARVVRARADELEKTQG